MMWACLLLGTYVVAGCVVAATEYYTSPKAPWHNNREIFLALMLAWPIFLIREFYFMWQEQ